MKNLRLYTSVLYDSTNGLPTSEANCIAQTEEGFIWIGGIKCDSKNRLWLFTYSENGDKEIRRNTA